jgi:transcriptional regulator with XRE-family HTH domain
MGLEVLTAVAETITQLAAPDTASPESDGAPPDPGSVTSPADFGRELTRAREIAGLTVREVARAAGLPVSTAGDYFAGRHLPNPAPNPAAAPLRRILAPCGITDAKQLSAWAAALSRARAGTPDPQNVTAQAAGPLARVVEDLPGANLCPDPGNSTSPAGLVEALRQFRIWAGEPSFREMERRCDGAVAASTMCKVLSRTRLPTLPHVLVIIATCGGTDEHRQAFASAWRRLRLAAERPSPGRPDIRLVPSASKAS